MLPFEKINTAVNNLLADNPTPTDQDIRALALDLAIEEYAVAIRSRLASRDSRLAQAQLLAENGFYILVEPGQKPIIIAEGATEVVMEQPARQSFKVKDKDLAAFAKQFGLDETALRAVGMGQRRDYKGWTRGTGMLGQYELGQPFREQKVKPTLPKKTEAKATRVVRPWSMPTIAWTPSED